jgi:PAS domain S-box-containing protein
MKKERLGTVQLAGRKPPNRPRSHARKVRNTIQKGNGSLRPGPDPPVLEGLLDALSLGFFQLDSKGRIQMMNQAMADLLGDKLAAFRSRRWEDLVYPDDRLEAEAKVRSLLDGGSRGLVLECRYFNQAGAPILRSTAFAPIPEAASGARGVVGLVSNLAGNARWKEERDRLEEQLARAQKMENLGMIAGGLAHDFNNFLEVILGFASLAKLRLPQDNEVQEPVRMIEEAALRAADLANQLLELTREDIGAGHSADPSEALRRMLKIIRRTFDRRILIKSRLDPGLPWIRGDRQSLEQAVLNLAINARDAMPEGGTLSVNASRLSIPPGRARTSGSRSPGEYVQVTVEDTGAGMELEVLRHIFEPLFTTKPEGEGTGLGLAMVRKAVEGAGGFLEVDSKPGEGSRFLLAFPAATADQETAGPATPRLIRGRGTVLVVDDEPLVRAFVEKGLKHLGYKVLAADNGLKACEIYASHLGKIECVLLDMVMPEMSGLETYAELRRLDPEVKVILSSGYSRSALGRGASSADFLGKPYTIESLSVAIKNAREDEA